MEIKNPFREIYDDPRFKNPYDYPLIDFPLLMDIEITNNCNLNCKMCLQQIMTREKGFMSMEIFKKIIDEASEAGCKGIRLIRFSEPFIHPRVFDMIEYAKSKGLLVHITTNGLLLDKEKISKIFDFKLDSIIFSFQGTNKEEYQKIRDNDKYDKLVSNIKELVEERSRREVDYPHIQITTTVLDETEEEKQRFIEKWSKIVDRVDLWYTTFAFIDNLERVKPLLKRQRFKQHAEEKLSHRKGRCNEVLTKMSTNWNGEIIACCAVANNDLCVGNITKETLKEIWHKDTYMKIREILAKGERNKIPFCSKCISKF